jgi:multidrug efflux pump subunit AcrA (membrane-fusion protein)
VTLGQNVMPARTLFVVADLSRLWLVLQIYERDLPPSGKVETVRVQLTALSRQSFKGVIDYVGAAVDLHTRTVADARHRGQTPAAR